MREYLSSMKNPRVQAFRSLKERKGRREHSAFLVEGDKMVGEALTSDFRVSALLLREDREIPEGLPEELPVYLMPEHVFNSLSDTRTPQGIAAVAEMRPRPLKGNRLIVLDGVQDPGNVGTILRTADAAGLDGAILSTECADVFSPKTLRATMGSIFRLGLEFPEDLASCLREMKTRGFSILSSQLDGESFYARERTVPPWALVIGSEGNGVSAQVRAEATCRLRLPMRGGAESLNAAVAAGIMMYDLMREEAGEQAEKKYFRDLQETEGYMPNNTGEKEKGKGVVPMAQERIRREKA